MVEILYDMDVELALSTLGAGSVVSQATKIDGTRGNGFRIAKVDYTGQLSNKTATEGPIVWGLACNVDNTQLAAILAGDPQNSTEDDDHGAGQWVKQMGMFSKVGTGAPAHGGGIDGSSDESHSIKVNWSVIEGQNFTIWARNNDTGALTTGTLLTLALTFYGVWLRD